MSLTEKRTSFRALIDFPEWQEKQSPLRFGHFAISEELFRVIVSAMGFQKNRFLHTE
ncbi:hypothetical protein NT05LI_0986 [Listeria ivanovii FSL F6-596]|nr:hypothetical protein NT05LI_0986 [Listeria ivanovii FSL F6-596]